MRRKSPLFGSLLARRLLDVSLEVGPAEQEMGPVGFSEMRRALKASDPPAMDETTINGAVLAALVASAEGPSLVLTRRASAIANFPGEVSFPGGTREPGDASLLETALRETNEEISVPPEMVDVWGRLSDLHAYGSRRIRAYVGRMSPRARPRGNATEVARIFDVPIAVLASPDVYEARILETPAQGDERRTIHYFRVDGEIVWGATGGLIAELLRTTCAWTPPSPPMPVSSYQDLRDALST